MEADRKVTFGARGLALALLAAALVGAPAGHARDGDADLLIVDTPERVTVVRRIGGVTVVDSQRRVVPRLRSASRWSGGSAA